MKNSQLGPYELNTIITGDARELAKALPDNSIHCICCSPPYWGLRDYGVADQIGLEETPEQYVQTMVELFRELRRALREDGTCWLNLGDCYAGSGKGRNADGSHQEGGKQGTNKGSIIGELFKGDLSPCLKPKDLVGIPWRVALALQADGWYLRSDIIWSKPNPMPESVTDRPTKAHEYIFLLTKSARYWYDAEAIREIAVYDGRNITTVEDRKRKGSPLMWGGNHERWPNERDGVRQRNRRTVWEVNQPIMKLRDDLTSEQRDYVLGELFQRGLL